MTHAVPLGLCRRELAEWAGEEGRREERRRGASSAEMGRRKKGAGALRLRGGGHGEWWPRARTRALAGYRRAKNYPTITGGNIFPAKNPVIRGLPGNPG